MSIAVFCMTEGFFCRFHVQKYKNYAKRATIFENIIVTLHLVYVIP